MKPADDIGSVAIVGLSCCFPGARNIDAFWRNLVQGVESITFFADDELLSTGVAPRLLFDPAYVKAGAVLEDIEGFDADFFDYSPREAALIDPQHRMFLECAWQALEDAGCPRDTPECRIGVFASASASTYLLENLADTLCPDQPTTSLQAWLGNEKDYLATRVSYKLNLKGPSLTVQTACSSSLVAVSLACQNLLTHQCDLALAGGARVSVPHRVGYLHVPGSILSPDGHCRAFDAKAQGTVFGNGVGVVALKRLADARADGDMIYAVIRGSAVNNDGSLKVGFTAPSRDGQAEVIAAALAAAGVSADTIDYIEAHGTGTAVGDPIEVAALTKAFRASTQRNGFCALGSVKSNLGHLADAAGIAGLIKTALALHHRLLPPSLHFEKPNSEITFSTTPFFVNTCVTEWTQSGSPRRAGVSAFGLGGTNAHVVLEEAPVAPRNGPFEPPCCVLPLSAKTPAALLELARCYHEFFLRSSEASWADVCFTAAVGRCHFGHRRAFLASSAPQLLELLGKFIAGQGPKNDVVGEKAEASPAPDQWSALAKAYELGESVDWAQAYAGSSARKTRTPTYPFQHQRFWIESTAARKTSVGNGWPSPQSWSAHLPARIKAALGGHIDELAASQEMQEYRALLDRLDELSPAFIVAVLGQMACELVPGREFVTGSLARDLGIADRHVRCLQRWLEILAEDGLLQSHLDGWKVLNRASLLDPERQLAGLQVEFPVGEAEIRLLASCLQRSAEVLRGRFEPLELFFPSGALDTAAQIYKDAPHPRLMNSLVRDAVLQALSHLPVAQPARILEIGAGTGGTTAFLLPHFCDPPVEYHFTDIGRFFVDRARRRFAGWPSVRCSVLDIERDPSSQGFALNSFNVVLAANVLHATRTLRQTLRHARQLLEPGGILVLLEITAPLRLEDLTSGLLEGWWRFEDSDLRPSSPLLSAERWQKLLQEIGFGEVVTLAPAAQSSKRLFTQSVIIAQNADDRALTSLAGAMLTSGVSRTAGEEPRGQVSGPDLSLRRALNGVTFSSTPSAPELAPAPTPRSSNGALKHAREAAAAVLGLAASDLPLDRPLFELGFDSLMAVELRHRLSTTCGVELAMLKVSEETCVSTLAETIERLSGNSAIRPAVDASGQPSSLPRCLLPIHAEGRRRPFFCVHPVAGSPMCYLDLAAALGPDQPFYGFQSPGLMDGGPPLRGIRDMAQCYFEAMQTVQPRGPYLLGGWSFGALVAWEMARLFEEKNERVELLALFDAGITTSLLKGQHTRISNLFGGALLILKNLYFLELPTSYARLRRLFQAVGISVPRSFREVWKRDFRAQWRFWQTIGKGAASSLRISIINFRAIKDYRPGTFHGNVTLFRASSSAPKADSLIEGMETLAPGRLTVHKFPGNHMAMILDPGHVKVLAAELRAALDETSDDCPASDERRRSVHVIAPIH